ncbi:MAG: LamB/YcsF family protein [Desulfobacteraceae bacterium]|nr:LamB/YcsF family protein [Desulfobacteraceae bacterium]
MEIDLHCDMGESFGIYNLGNDEEMMKYVTSISVGCGFHAGDPHVMRKTVALAKQHGVAVGAHPGYPDLMGFGRRKMEVTPEEAKDYILYQVGALTAFCQAAGLELQHVKPHGEFYQMPWRDEALARGILEAIQEIKPEPIFLALYNTIPYEMAQSMGMRVAGELYGDLDYYPDGTTFIKKVHGEIDPEATVEKVLKMVLEEKVIASDGKEIEVKGKSVCLHGDNPRAPEIAQTLREELEKRGVKIVSLGLQSYS